jgi:hypothetical protein
MQTFPLLPLTDASAYMISLFYTAIGLNSGLQSLFTVGAPLLSLIAVALSVHLTAIITGSWLWNQMMSRIIPAVNNKRRIKHMKRSQAQTGTNKAATEPQHDSSSDPLSMSAVGSVSISPSDDIDLREYCIDMDTALVARYCMLMDGNYLGYIRW